MSQKKLSTAEILKLARSKDGGGAAASPTPPENAPAPAGEAPQPQPAAETPPPAAAKPATPPKPAAGKPKSTADILAAARGQSAAAASSSPAEPKPAAPAKPAAPGAKPKGTADILAAARGGGAAAAAPAQKTAGAEKPAPKSKPTAPAAATGAAGLSVQEMLKAVKEGTPKEAEAKPKPKLPAKPVAGKAAAAPAETRRTFFSSLFEPFAAGWTMIAAIGGLWSLLTARFMLPNTVVEAPSRFKIGPASDYPLNAVSTKWTAAKGVWIVHTDQYDGRNLMYALQTVCTHLGCTPSWLDGEQKYKCPCHGSGFYMTGINFEGPAPRPLERVGIRISEDGQVEVDKSVKFQEELGQWADGSSFLELT